MEHPSTATFKVAFGVPGWSGGTVNQQVLLAKKHRAGMLAYSTVCQYAIQQIKLDVDVLVGQDLLLINRNTTETQRVFFMPLRI